MSKNIFYVSNTQPELFPQNSRTKFDQYIDINELDYIKYNDLEVAVKSISFDTSFDRININNTRRFFSETRRT